MTFKDSATVIIVLGGSNDPEGTLSQMSQDRCDQAERTHRKHPSSPILLTGGWGPHFNESPTAHAEWVQAELVRRGIPEPLFLPHAHSGYTEADAALAAEVLANVDYDRLLLITSDFHVERALFYFYRYFPPGIVQAVPAPSSLPETELRQRIAHEAKRLAALRASDPADS